MCDSFAFSFALILSVLWISINAQQFPNQYYNEDESPKGVCTINGKAFYGLDCWCYSDGLGTSVIVISIVTLVVFFFVSGCIWKGIFSCFNSFKREDDFGMGPSSARSSMRSMRKRPEVDTQI